LTIEKIPQIFPNSLKFKPIMQTQPNVNKDKALKLAFVLSLITIFYNIAEGLFSVFFGATDDTLALLGFGIDSFVEVISGIGIAHMLIRMKISEVDQRDKFERQALKITGYSFYLLTLGLIAGAIINIVKHTNPETTMAGIIISSISILTMYFLMMSKLRAGKKLNSDAIIADAHCTRTCLYLSFILLASSLLYEIFKIPYIDLAGSLGIAWFAFTEGRESLEKSRSESLSCDCCGDKHQC
jgi:divalent metal cation (Fe/Co/Zn/Cd) transporter